MEVERNGIYGKHCGSRFGTSEGRAQWKDYSTNQLVYGTSASGTGADSWRYQFGLFGEARPECEAVDANGCSATQLDADSDGVSDALDLCPATPPGEIADTNGCSPSQLDTDSDGVNDAQDQCPATPAGETVDASGCSASQKDSDNDGIPDNQDNCTHLSNADQRDTDGDGFGNRCDPDFNGNGIVDPTDFSTLKGLLGSTTSPDQDLNGNGIVDPSDFSIAKSFFGKPPGPSCCGIPLP